jgi:hypothetical protein
MHGREKEVRHAVHGGRGGKKTDKQCVVAYCEEELVAVGVDKWHTTTYIGAREGP